MSFIEEIKSKLDLSKLYGYRMLLVGGAGVVIEGHRGVYEISDTIIRIRVKKGSIIVNGHDLIIKDISDSEIYIEGSIKGIEL